ncbi:hypothetical protein [Nitrosomonas sp. Nm34]|uniref:hypothetical protein n=1 Tax=Nitrosomonas sp. Nm34 TaxID=1881055 RepID=UPI0008EB7F52|nr:hypothetical protein [Nitrosomonas sp. Nm34]SFI17824.1 hypothetical protein SAMN05428978_100183 [Nitrosomonas sp. Nm34]
MRQPAVPQVWSEKAEMVGLPGVCYVVRSDMPEFTQDAIESLTGNKLTLPQKAKVLICFLLICLLPISWPFQVMIRNARLDPDWAEVERRALSIAARAITSLIQNQGIGDLYKLYSQTQRDGIDFNLAFIPKDFNTPHLEEFDTESEYMRQLFQRGYNLAIKN